MTDAGHTPVDLTEMRARLRQAALLTSGAGIGFGLLAIASWVLLRLDA